MDKKIKESYGSNYDHRIYLDIHNITNELGASFLTDESHVKLEFLSRRIMASSILFICCAVLLETDLLFVIIEYSYEGIIISIFEKQKYRSVFDACNTIKGDDPKINYNDSFVTELKLGTILRLVEGMRDNWEKNKFNEITHNSITFAESLKRLLLHGTNENVKIETAKKHRQIIDLRNSFSFTVYEITKNTIRIFHLPRLWIDWINVHFEIFKILFVLVLIISIIFLLAVFLIILCIFIIFFLPLIFFR